jgi:hypothetical protein
MWSRFKSSVIADMKIISHDAMLLVVSLVPLLLIILLKLVFPIFSHFIFLKSGFFLDKYYSLTAITLVSLIPVFLGVVYAFILLDNNDLQINQESDVTPVSVRNSLYSGAFMYFLYQSGSDRRMVKNYFCDYSFVNPIPVCFSFYREPRRK